MLGPLKKHIKVENLFIIVTLTIAPLALGSVNVWAYYTIAVIALITFNIHFLRSPNNLPKTLKNPVSIGFVLFLLFNLIYILPMPDAIINILSSGTYKLRETYMLTQNGSQYLSVYPRATVGYLIKITTYFMVFLTIVSRISYGNNGGEDSSSISIPRRSFLLLGALCGMLSLMFHGICDFNAHIPANALYFTVLTALVTSLTMKTREGGRRDYRFVNMLVNSIIIIAFAIALFGIIQKLGYNGKIYWVISRQGLHFGPYINYDHYAGFMEMCAFLAIANFMAKISTSSFVHLKKLKDKFIWFSSREASLTLLYLYMAIVMIVSLFMCTSRGGIMSFCAVFAIFYFVCMISAQSNKKKRMIFAALMVAIFIVIMFSWIGPEETLDRFDLLNRAIRAFIQEKAILSELRPHMWKDTLHICRDYPFFGTGMGTYYVIFSKYRTFSENFGFLRFAHNDYLQFVSETGVLGGMFLLGFLIWYLRKFISCLKRLKGSLRNI